MYEKLGLDALQTTCPLIKGFVGCKHMIHTRQWIRGEGVLWWKMDPPSGLQIACYSEHISCGHPSNAGKTCSKIWAF
jgi:hypothetical protein